MANESKLTKVSIRINNDREMFSRELKLIIEMEVIVR